MKDVIKSYNEAEIPIDTIWSDLDYMKEKAIFTIDSTVYPPASFKSFLEEQNLHWVPLIDVGVHTSEYNSNEMGKEMDVFIKTKNDYKTEYLAQVWPGKVHFVDYLHPKSSLYW